MIRWSTVLLAFILTACATAAVAPVDRQSWDACRCGWLEEETRALAGPDFVDCGFVNLLEDSSDERLHDGMRCARQAFKQSRAFRYGSLRIPMDSYAREILIRSGDGKLWLVTHDMMLDGDAQQLWKQRCSRLRFKSGNSGYVISGCETDKELAQ